MFIVTHNSNIRVGAVYLIVQQQTSPLPNHNKNKNMTMEMVRVTNLTTFNISIVFVNVCSLDNEFYCYKINFMDIYLYS